MLFSNKIQFYENIVYIYTLLAVINYRKSTKLLTEQQEWVCLIENWLKCIIDLTRQLLHSLRVVN